MTKDELAFDLGQEPLVVSSLATVEVAGRRPFERTAVIMIGFQHDYFSEDGKLHAVIEASSENVLRNTMRIIDTLKGTSVLMIETPIIFTEDYSELVEPSGILKIIKDVQAFRAGHPGADTLPDITNHGERILKVPGKRGLNAFTGTCLEMLLKSENITDVVLCGAVTSVCIDSTGRAAHERGFRVHQLSDCTCGRTEAEQDQYCNEIFPLYANVVTTDEILEVIIRAELGKTYSPPQSLSSFKQSNVVQINAAGKQVFGQTAIILIGYQHDYFGEDGKLHAVIDASSDKVLKNTLRIIDALIDTSTIFVETPIIFTEDYRELVEPSGILKVIKDVQAFKAGDPGAETIPELKRYGSRILHVPGKRGLNAFTGTCLEGLLKMEKVTDVVLCGAVTSVCIDSTGRAAHERGFRVHQLSDCTCGRTQAEQEHYCKDIFPLYADVTTTDAMLEAVKTAQSSCEGAAAVKEKSSGSMQAQLNVMNSLAGEALDAEEVVDEQSYQDFDQHVSVSHILRWMQLHPDEVPKINERREEISIQIQHKLIDLAASTQKSYEEMERQVTQGDNVDIDEDMSAPMVTFLSHGKVEAGSLCRLLKLMLRRILQLSRRNAGEDENTACRIFLDSDDMYSQSDLLGNVRESKTMTLVLTKSVFFRPWIICEFITAWRAGVPIIPVEVVDSSFSITPQNARRMITENLDENCINLVSQYCANTTLETVVEAVIWILQQPRVVFDPKSASSVQWAVVFDLAKLLNQKAMLGDDYTVDFLTDDPVRAFSPTPQPNEDYSAFITYHHTEENVVVARILKLMTEAELARSGSDTRPVFLDMDSLFDLNSLTGHMQRADNHIVLLSEDTLKRPWVIIELVQGFRSGIPMIPVPIVKDFDFRPYVGEGAFYVNLADKYDASAKELFQEWRIQFPEIVRAMRYLFNVIATPFYGHSSQAVQSAQIIEITRRMKVLTTELPMRSSRSLRRLTTSQISLPLIHSNPNLA
jgi:nicotinamidase-related amidase